MFYKLFHLHILYGLVHFRFTLLQGLFKAAFKNVIEWYEAPEALFQYRDFFIGNEHRAGYMRVFKMKAHSRQQRINGVHHHFELR